MLWGGTDQDLALAFLCSELSAALPLSLYVRFVWLSNFFLTLARNGEKKGRSFRPFYRPRRRLQPGDLLPGEDLPFLPDVLDRKSTRLNSSHM